MTPEPTHFEPKSPLPRTLISDEEIQKRFNYHAPDAAKVILHENFREHCKCLAHIIKETIPPGREQAEAMTHLEDVMMWGNAGIARN